MKLASSAISGAFKFLTKRKNAESPADRVLEVPGVAGTPWGRNFGCHWQAVIRPEADVSYCCREDCMRWQRSERHRKTHKSIMVGSHVRADQPTPFAAELEEGVTAGSKTVEPGCDWRLTSAACCAPTSHAALFLPMHSSSGSPRWPASLPDRLPLWLQSSPCSTTTLFSLPQ